MRTFKNTILFFLSIGSLVYLSYSIFLYSKNPCDQPLKYSIGRLDKQFGVEEETFKTRIKEAESVWEKVLGKDIFVYDPESEFKINLVYDERQLATVQKQKTEFGLSEVETVLEKLDFEFNQMKSSYDDRVSAYKNTVSNFEKRQADYESRVDYWNDRGGAPKKEYESLRTEADYLKAEANKLNIEAAALNKNATELNSLLDRRNQAASQYNQVAKSYNEKYGHGLEFNQAEYNGKEINVYQFTTQNDLEVALAHELGHAIGMNHVENPSSIMYYITGGNTEVSLVPSAEDLVELERVCK